MATHCPYCGPAATRDTPIQCVGVHPEARRDSPSLTDAGRNVVDNYSHVDAELGDFLPLFRP